MAESGKNHSNDLDLNAFKVLLIYANSPMDNLMPVSISSLSGALKRRGFDVKLFDTTFYKWTDIAGGERSGSLQVAEFDYSTIGIDYIESNVFEDFQKLVEEYKPNLIGLSTVEPTHEFGVRLISHVRDFKIPTIVGGVHTIFSPDDVINEENVDMICVGEGEKCIVELCEKMAKCQDYSTIENIWTKKDGIVCKNKKAPLLTMNSLPKLDFSIFDDKRFYRPMDGQMYRMVPIEFSRGCVYNCSYCSAPAFAEKFKDQGRWLRYKSVSQIMEEINSYISKYKIEYFYFVSETFLAITDEKFYDFCEQYSKIATPFWFNTRPETITSERIKMLEEIGCHRISVGVECGNEDYRRKMLKRKINNVKIVEACKIVSKSSIQLSVNNIIGFPDETRSMIFDTIHLNKQIDANSYSCSIFQPYRGTELHKYCVRKGYIEHSNLSMDLTMGSPLKQPCITNTELKGIARTFPLHIKFPEHDFNIIRKAERFDEEGNRTFDELLKIYRKKYEGN